MGNYSQRELIICDIDGTLADNSHRQHHVRQKPKNWKAWNAGISEDRIYEPIRRIVNHFHFAGFEIVLMSGRNEFTREVTEQWLRDYSVFYDRLHMRADGDFRADYIVKEELLNQHIPDKSKVVFVLDDRNQVVDMWRRNGLTCLQVREGNF